MNYTLLQIIGLRPSPWKSVWCTNYYGRCRYMHAYKYIFFEGDEWVEDRTGRRCQPYYA